MTNKELKELGEYLRTEAAVEEGRKLQLAVKEGKRTPESLTDREVVLCTSCSQGYYFFLLFWRGTIGEKEKGIKLMRKALTQGKNFSVFYGEEEGVFESEEEMEEYLSQLEFHMSII